MTLRTLISFDHVQLNTVWSVPFSANYVQSALNTQYGVPGAVMTAASANAPLMSGGIGSPVWMVMGASNGSFYAGYVISFADLGILQNGVTQAWIGFRTYAQVSGGGSVVGLLPTSAGGASGVNINPLLTETQLNRLGTGVAFAQYVEVFIDISANTYQSYVNGNLTASGSFPAGQQYIVFGGQVFSGSGGQAFKDFYFLDVDATKPNGRLGPITATPLVPASGTGITNWASFVDTFIGTASISNAISKFGGGSLSCPSTTSAVVVPDFPALRVTPTSGDATIEFWMYPGNISQSAILLGKDNNGSPFGRLTIQSNSFLFYNDSAAVALTVASGQVANTWYHIALVRYQGTWYLYQNGVLLGQIAGGTFGNNTNNLYIGNSSAQNGGFTGNIEELRVSNVARYTAPFTPPTLAFTPDANTNLLMHFDASQTGYVADQAGVQPSALGTAYAAATSMVPCLQNGPDNPQMTLNFTPTVLTGQKVVAMQYKMAAQVPFAINMVAALKEGGTTKNLPNVQIRDTAAQYGRDVAGLQVLAPDGLGWTATSIAATALQLTPQSTTAGSLN
jgi:hypothetical protein